MGRNWTERREITLDGKSLERVACIDTKTKVYHILLIVLLRADELFLSLILRLPEDQMEKKYLSWSNCQLYNMAHYLNFVAFDIQARPNYLEKENIVFVKSSFVNVFEKLEADFIHYNSNMGFISSTVISNMIRDLNKADRISLWISWMNALCLMIL